jgi:RHS repeat-associated protein
MQPALRSPIPEASLAVFPVNGENSHQGLMSENPALYPGREVCNFTVLLGMRGQAELNRVRPRSTGKERDAESGLDNFGARYYGSTMGRFMSPDGSDDPDPIPNSDLDSPQSLNRYSYVLNNPLTNTDPDGHDCVTQTRTSDSTESVSVNSGGCSGNVGDGQSQTYVNGTVTGISVNGGNSLDIGYNSYDGSSSGVTNAASAPIPDNPGIAFGYNQAGYNQLAGASRIVNAAGSLEMNIMAPWAGAAAGCLSGGSAGSCGASMAMALFPELKGIGLLAKEETAIAGVLKQIAQGTTKGKAFENFAGSLPGQAAGYYREYTVPLAGQVGRGAARLVVGAGGEVFYTADHYATFTRIR